MPISLGSAYGEIQIGTESAENNVKGLASQMADVGTTLSLGVSAPLLGVAATALKSAGDFEQAMNQMQVISGSTGDQMKEMQALALKLGADTSFSAGEAAQGLLELSKAGLSAEQAMKAIPGVMDLAAAGDLSVAQAAEIASNALNSFHLPADKAKDVANLFAAAANASSIEVTDMAQSMAQAGAVAASYGQSIETAATAVAILGNNGIKGSDAGTSLKTMLSRLAAPTGDAATLMKQLGINVYDASGKMRPLPAILADMQKGLHGTMTITEQNAGATSANSKQAKHYLDIINQTKQKLADYQSGVAGVAQSEKDKVVAVDRLNRVLAAAQAEYAKLGGVQATTTTKTVQMTDELRNQALYTLFGSDAIRAANILLKEGATGWDEMSAAVNKEGVAQDVANARMKGFNGAIEYVKGSLDSFLIETALPFLDSFSGIIRSVGDAITAIGGLPEPVKNAALAFLAVLAVAGPVLLAITGVGAVLGALLSPVGLVIMALSGLAAAFAADWFGIRTTTTAFANYISAVLDAGANSSEAAEAIGLLPPSLQGIVGGIGQTVDGLRSYSASVQDAGFGSIEAQEAISLFPPALQGIIGPVDQTIGALLNYIATVQDAGFGSIEAQESISLFPSALQTAIASIDSFIPTFATTLQTTFAAIQTAWAALVALFAPSLARLGESILAFGAQVGGMGGQFQGLLAAAQNLWTALQPILTQLAVLIGVTIGVVALNAVNLLAATFQNLGPILSAALNQVTNILNTLATVITATVALVVALIHGDWTAAWEQAKTIVATLGTFMQTSLANFATVIGASFAIIGATISNTLKDLGFAAAGEMVSAFTEKITALVDWVSKLVSGDVSLNLKVPAWIETLTAWVWPTPTEEDWVKKLIAWAWPEKAPTWMTSFINWTWPNTPREVISLIGWKFPDVPQPIKDIITWVWPDAPQVISDLLDWEFPDVPKAIDNLLNFQWPDLTTPDWIQSFVDAINALINWSMPDMNPFNAGGSSYFMGGMTHLNERGRELVAIPADQAILPAGSRIYTNGQANRMMAGGEGGGNLVNIEKVYVTNQQDIHALAWQVDNLRRRQAGR